MSTRQLVYSSTRLLVYLSTYKNITMNTIIFIGGIGFQEVLIIALGVLLFFGGKKIPELMRGLGKGVKSFKEGMNDVRKELDDISTDIETDSKEEKK